jgi:eukaryotic-like serine/threonine-protein kinase
MALAPGSCLGSYRIVRLLGAGGMGEVYLAEDTRLGRRVALKVLPPQFAGDLARVKRFQREARLTSGLTHPNIVSIFDVGEDAAGFFLAMEYIEGSSLRAHLTGQPLEVGWTLNVLCQVSEALKAAHAAGIVHRDIKPENILISATGHVKVVDFGLAHQEIESVPGVSENDATQSALTVDGDVMGTIKYMSPEQLRGRPADHRSDIFSFGLVAYEMLAGRRPADADPDADPPGVFSRSETSVSIRLERVVRKCLAFDPAHRYQSAGELASELSLLKRELESDSIRRGEFAPDGTPRKPAGWLREYWPVPVALLLLILLAAGFYYRQRTPRTPAPESIAVLPFENATGNPALDYAADGLSDALEQDLSRLPAVRLPAHTMVRRYRGPNVNPVAAAKDLGVDVVLTGRLRQKDEKLEITAELTDAHTGMQVWSQTYTESTARLMNVEAALWADVARRLERDVHTGGGPRPSNSEAYDLYLWGRYYLNQPAASSLETAIGYLQRACAKDPRFALAQASLASAYVSMANYGVMPPAMVLPKAKEAAQRALDVDPTIAGAHVSYGLAIAVGDFNWAGAERSFQRALALDPNNSETHALYAITVLTPLLRADDARIEARRAVDLEPKEGMRKAVATTVAYMSRRFEESLWWLSQLEGPRFATPRSAQEGLCYLAMGKPAEALAALSSPDASRDQTSTFKKSVLGGVYAAQGRTADAEAIATELEEQAKQVYVSPYHRAVLQLALHHNSRAIELLNEAYERRDISFRFIGADVALDPLRSDPAFRSLLAKAGLP